jgi:Flp pilus assembly protein TadD
MNQSQTRVYDLGRFYIQTGRNRQASQILAVLVAAMPNSGLAHFQLGVALLQQFSRSREAVYHFRQAAHLCPQLAIAWRFLGWMLVRIERDLVSARELVNELKQIHPNQAKRLSHLIDLNDPQSEDD